MSKNIEKSSIVTQKEQVLIDLQKAKKKLLTQLKRNKTTLQKLKEEAINIQKNMGGRMMGMMMNMSELKNEVSDLLKQVLASKKIAEEEKDGLEDVIAMFDDFDMMEEMTGMSAEEFAKKQEESGFNTDEFDRQRAFDMFSQFSVEPEEKDQKGMRKAYLKLAARFHPDKAKSKKEKEQFHALMQQIISAYERGDMEELLSLEAKYAEVATLADMDISNEVAIIDFLDIEIDKVSRETDLLEKQLLRVKQEVKNIRKSDLGDMIKAQKDARKYGYNTLEEEADMMQQEFDNLEATRDGLKEYLETGVMPESVKQAFMQPSMDEDLFDLEELLMFFDEDDEDDEEDEDLDISPEDIIATINKLFEAENTPPPPKRKRRRRKK